MEKALNEVKSWIGRVLLIVVSIILYNINDKFNSVVFTLGKIETKVQVLINDQHHTNEKVYDLERELDRIRVEIKDFPLTYQLKKKD